LEPTAEQGNNETGCARGTRVSGRNAFRQSLAVAAGIATLKSLKKPGTYRKLDAAADSLANGIRKAAIETEVPLEVNRAGSMFTAFFSPAPVTDFKSAKDCDTVRYGRFFMLFWTVGYICPVAIRSLFHLAGSSAQRQSSLRSRRYARLLRPSPHRQALNPADRIFQSGESFTLSCLRGACGLRGRARREI